MIPDLDFVRALLLKTHDEMKGVPPGWKTGEEHTRHVLYLQEAGLSHIHSQRGDNRIVAAVPTKLTPLGVSLLNAIRDESVWARVKERLGHPTGPVSITLMIDLAGVISRNQ